MPAPKNVEEKNGNKIGGSDLLQMNVHWTKLIIPLDIKAFFPILARATLTSINVYNMVVMETMLELLGCNNILCFSYQTHVFWKILHIQYPFMI